MKIVTKKETNQNGVRIWKYYLFGCIPYLTKERTYKSRKTVLLNICISKHLYKLTYFKNTLNIAKLFQKKEINISDATIDIIIPIYNGFNFLNNLFRSIEKNTDLPYRIFAINDCSTDERILPLLESWNKTLGSKMLVINNDVNLGFVKSVNLALKQTSNHVVLLNTDVILPKNWASRLFYPIFTEQNVGSVTPFSNSATIFSIPKICENNDFEGDLEKVNDFIGKISTPYERIKLPTGVGFCMAMNKNAINEVGFLDEIFGKGYGEENDWCQRITKKGYINTIAADLFVWHQHGGSFISEEKEKLIKEHLAVLQKRYPKYNYEVSNIIKDETFKSLRFVAEILYFSALATKTEIWFDHTWGGGTETYTYRQFDDLKTDTLCIRVQNNQSDSTLVTFFYKDYSSSILIDFDDVMHLLSHIKTDKIVLNNIASYFDPIKTLDEISKLKRKLNAKISFRCHDLFAICPTINMINNKDEYCNVDTFDRCSKCFSSINGKRGRKIKCSIQIWHEQWNKFLSDETDEVLVFSQSTADIFSKYYPETKNKIKILPHYVPKLRKVNIEKHNGINIAVLGNIGVIKGYNILKEMNSKIKKYKNTKIIVVGKTEKRLSHIKSTGTYTLDDLPSVMEKNNVDIVFIPSIWPETFSYTTSEAMMMGLPVACFDMGAPAERVKKYEKGLIIEKIDGQYALDSIINFIRRQRNGS